jgi:hypothetical protein
MPALSKQVTDLFEDRLPLHAREQSDDSRPNREITHKALVTMVLAVSAAGGSKIRFYVLSQLKQRRAKRKEENRQHQDWIEV